MCDVKELFYSLDGKDPIEGYLGDSNECEILFVLREPHEESVNGFWFNKKVVNPETQEERQGQKYFKSLGTLAYKLLGGKDDSPCDCKLEAALRKCAYINIYPFSGENRASYHYNETLKKMKEFVRDKTSPSDSDVYKESDDIKDCHKRIAMNRLQIIQTMDWKILVTVCGAFEAITNRNANDCCEGIKVGYKSGKKPDKVFRVASYNNACNKRIVSFYHPSHPCACNVENLTIPEWLKLSVLDC